MIAFVAAKLKEIFEKGRDYPWPKPEICPCCKDHKLWGHGFVESYFDGFTVGLLLRRYRCPLCGCIVKLRPSGYFSRFQASIGTIRSSISHRLKKGRWPPGLSHSRQGHWLRALLRKVQAYLGHSWKRCLIKAFDYLLEQGKVPVSRSI
jgi:hypothetical protein